MGVVRGGGAGVAVGTEAAAAAAAFEAEAVEAAEDTLAFSAGTVRSEAEVGLADATGARDPAEPFRTGASNDAFAASAALGFDEEGGFAPWARVDVVVVEVDDDMELDEREDGRAVEEVLAAVARLLPPAPPPPPPRLTSHAPARPASIDDPPKPFPGTCVPLMRPVGPIVSRKRAGAGVGVGADAEDARTSGVSPCSLMSLFVSMRSWKPSRSCRHRRPSFLHFSISGGVLGRFLPVYLAKSVP